ncbi:MAG: acetolactate synthase small subunit, partial [Actinobacteria bacterium]|nr:acetolactate synthase small subunit [Actinomycetota bacterium]
ISALFSRRGYNIESLAVGTTETEGVSRMTVVVNVDAHALEQVTKQLNKLINVLKIVELDDNSAIARELMLIKVKADDNSRSKVLELVELFRAKIVDVSGDAVTIEATGSIDKLEAFLNVLAPHGIKEIVQSGVVALARGGRSIADRSNKNSERSI